MCNISAAWDDMLCYFDDDIIYVECICLLSMYLWRSCRLFAGKSMSTREVNFTRIESCIDVENVEKAGGRVASYRCSSPWWKLKYIPE